MLLLQLKISIETKGKRGMLDKLKDRIKAGIEELKAPFKKASSRTDKKSESGKKSTSEDNISERSHFYYID